MKVAVIVYHKNINNIYPEEWIEKFRETILNQTYKDFDIFELNYGGTEKQLFLNSKFSMLMFPSFVHAMNLALSYCFILGYDVVFNTNCDDYYPLDRIEKQLPYFYQGYDIVSSNFALIEDDKEVLVHKFHDRNIQEELDKNHNVICHPVVGYSKEFWKKNRYYPHEVPFEDMKLWQRGIKTHKFIILEDILCYHRLHKDSVGHKGEEK